LGCGCGSCFGFTFTVVTHHTVSRLRSFWDHTPRTRCSHTLLHLRLPVDSVVYTFSLHSRLHVYGYPRLLPFRLRYVLFTCVYDFRCYVCSHVHITLHVHGFTFPVVYVLRYTRSPYGYVSRFPFTFTRFVAVTVVWLHTRCVALHTFTHCTRSRVHGFTVGLHTFSTPLVYTRFSLRHVVTFTYHGCSLLRSFTVVRLLHLHGLRLHVRTPPRYHHFYTTHCGFVYVTFTHVTVRLHTLHTHVSFTRLRTRLVYTVTHVTFTVGRLRFGSGFTVRFCRTPHARFAFVTLHTHTGYVYVRFAVLRYVLVGYRWLRFGLLYVFHVCGRLHVGYRPRLRLPRCSVVHVTFDVYRLLPVYVCVVTHGLRFYGCVCVTAVTGFYLPRVTLFTLIPAFTFTFRLRYVWLRWTTTCLHVTSVYCTGLTFAFGFCCHTGCTRSTRFTVTHTVAVHMPFTYTRSVYTRYVGFACWLRATRLRFYLRQVTFGYHVCLFGTNGYTFPRSGLLPPPASVCVGLHGTVTVTVVWLHTHTRLRFHVLQFYRFRTVTHALLPFYRTALHLPPVHTRSCAFHWFTPHVWLRDLGLVPGFYRCTFVFYCCTLVHGYVHAVFHTATFTRLVARSDFTPHFFVHILRCHARFGSSCIFRLRLVGFRFPRFTVCITRLHLRFCVGRLRFLPPRCWVVTVRAPFTRTGWTFVPDAFTFWFGLYHVHGLPFVCGYTTFCSRYVTHVRCYVCYPLLFIFGWLRFGPSFVLPHYVPTTHVVVVHRLVHVTHHVVTFTVGFTFTFVYILRSYRSRLRLVTALPPPFTYTFRFGLPPHGTALVGYTVRTARYIFGWLPVSFRPGLRWSAVVRLVVTPFIRLVPHTRFYRCHTTHHTRLHGSRHTTLRLFRCGYAVSRLFTCSTRLRDLHCAVCTHVHGLHRTRYCTFGLLRFDFTFGSPTYVAVLYCVTFHLGYTAFTLPPPFYTDCARLPTRWFPFTAHRVYTTHTTVHVCTFVVPCALFAFTFGYRTVVYACHVFATHVTYFQLVGFGCYRLFTHVTFDPSSVYVYRLIPFTVTFRCYSTGCTYVLRFTFTVPHAPCHCARWFVTVTFSRLRSFT